MARPALDYLILDAVANDIESFAHIREQIASSTSTQSWQLIVSLRRLVQQRLVEAYSVPGERGKLVSAGEGVWPPADAEDIWFRITGRGKMVHETWVSGSEGAA